MRRLILVVAVVLASIPAINAEEANRGQDQNNPAPSSHVSDGVRSNETPEKSEYVRYVPEMKVTLEALKLARDGSTLVSEARDKLSKIESSFDGFEKPNLDNIVMQLRSIKADLQNIEEDVNPSWLSRIFDHFVLNILWGAVAGSSESNDLGWLGYAIAVLSIFVLLLRAWILFKKVPGSDQLGNRVVRFFTDRWLVGTIVILLVLGSLVVFGKPHGPEVQPDREKSEKATVIENPEIPARQIAELGKINEKLDQLIQEANPAPPVLRMENNERLLWFVTLYVSLGCNFLMLFAWIRSRKPKREPSTIYWRRHGMSRSFRSWRGRKAFRRYA